MAHHSQIRFDATNIVCDLLKSQKQIERIGEIIMAVAVSAEDCVGCGACVDLCPAAALELNGDNIVEVNDDCVDCGSCVATCPSGALTL